MGAHLIAIVGGSGSGKTWLARQLQQQFRKEAGRLSMDDFYFDLSHLPPGDRDATNFDHPRSIDWALFRRSVTRMRRGQSTKIASYDFVTHTRRTEKNVCRPMPLMFLDGLWLLHRAELRRLYSLSVFVECPEEVRLGRRLQRDLGERGRCSESIRAQFARQVSPLHRRFVAPQARHADVVLDSLRPHRGIAQLGELLCRLLQNQGVQR